MTKHLVAIASLLLLCGGYFAGRNWGDRRMSSEVLQATYSEVCRLVDEYYFEDTKALHEWVTHCHQQSLALPKRATLRDLINNIQTELPKLPVSHLDFWDPSSSRLLWDGLSHETGLRVREIESHFIVFDVIPGSPADRAGVQSGDEILSCDGRKPLDTLDIRFKVQSCSIQRSDAQISTDLRGEDVQLDQNPEVFEINSKTVWLKIPSFLSPFFDGDEWKKAAANLTKYDRVILDVRDNGGGYFVTMLKAVSPFFCKPAIVGRLVQPRKTSGPAVEFRADSSFEDQNTVVDSSRVVTLKTYDGYPCVQADVRVLMDQDTASTAEIFASAFRLRKHAKLMGETTGGAVVLASWFPLPLGTGYRISIPQAMFETADGARIEGVGLRPQVQLTYVLGEARAGDDSWLLRAME